MLLGLASVDLSSADWDSAVDHGDGSAAAASKSTISGLVAVPPPPPTTKPKIHHVQSGPPPSSSTPPDIIFRSCFDRAFSLSSNGVMSKPPVSIIDMSATNRGYALIASRDIPRGEIIYTELAAEASKMPRQCLICRNTKEEKVKIQGLYRVKGCQHCFQSLEPASSILSCDTAKLPMEEYWPVLDENKPGPARRSVQCQECNALFCSKQCHESHNNIMGNCCRCSNAVQAAVHAFCSQINSSTDKEEDSTDKEASISVEPSKDVLRGSSAISSQYR